LTEIPKASVPTAVTAKLGLRRNVRNAKRRF